MKVTTLLPLALLCVSLASGQSDEVCFPIHRGQEGHRGPTDQAAMIQGHPGKVGPQGPKGSIGAPGGCSCDPSEVDQLRIKIRNLEETVGILDKLHGNIDKPVVCSVGIRNRRVKDRQFTASTSYDERFSPHFARLDSTKSSSQYGVWEPRESEVGAWIEVDLETPRHVTAIITQGRPEDYNFWVTSFKISYGNATDQLRVIQDGNQTDRIFQGNSDQNTYATNVFPEPITARYFRVIVQSWNRFIAIRLEFLTC